MLPVISKYSRYFSNPPSQLINEPIAHQLWKAIQADQEKRDEISRLEQGTDNWLKARHGRLTASTFGSIHGSNPYQTQDQLIDQLLNHSFQGNQATQWGTDHEPMAREYYRGYQTAILNLDQPLEIEEKGLVIHKEYPWLAASPDGLILPNDFDSTPGVLEIKCPFRKKIYGLIPPYYYDQIQGLMEIHDVNWCDFVVWTPTQVDIKRYERDVSYWNNNLFPSLSKFYFEKYIPSVVSWVKVKQQENLV